MVKRILACAIMMFVVGCAKGGGDAGASATATPSAEAEEKFIVNEGPETAQPLEVKSALARTDAAHHALKVYLANFELNQEWLALPVDEKMTEDGQIYIMMSIPGESGKKLAEMIPTGDNKIKFLEIYRLQGNSVKKTFLDRDNHQGGIKITEMTENLLKASLDVSDEDGVKVQGDFTANRV